jgi:hypothetical protein
VDDQTTRLGSAKTVGTSTGRLSYAEVGAWLGRADGVPSGGATLAELLALRDGTPPVSTPDPEPVGGFYL